MKEFKKTDYGVIDWGMYRGRQYSEIPIHYLKYIVSKECEFVSEERKEICRKELSQRNILEGQIELF